MSEANVAIRVARASDAPVLCAAERETARVPGRLVSLPQELHDDAFARKIAEHAELGSYLVAERDGAVVGHAVLDFAGPQAALAHVRTLTIVVHPGCTGQGIGTALMNALRDWVRAHPQVVRVELRVRETNAAAIHLYKKFGFSEETRFRRRLKMQDGKYLDDIGMTYFAEAPQP